MQRILLVKTTSLGDVVHCLPAVTDMATLFPGVAIDWVVEETYVDVVRLHPGVSRVLPVAIRRWRKNLASRATRDEMAQFRRDLRSQHYDLVIDAQGLAKSALIARMARGERHGLDRASAREWIAALAYEHCHPVPWTLDAVARNRKLVGDALGYVPRGAPDYAITAAARAFDWLPPGPYCVCLSGTTDAAKLWPEDSWRELALFVCHAGLACVLPAGTGAEYQRAERIAAAIGGAGDLAAIGGVIEVGGDGSNCTAVVAPALGLAELAQLIVGAALVVGVDTGLTHLAGALARPTVGIFCGTSPRSTGVVGTRVRNVGEVARTPSSEAVWQAAVALVEAQAPMPDAVVSH